jgi:hypothetical protein
MKFIDDDNLTDEEYLAQYLAKYMAETKLQKRKAKLQKKMRLLHLTYRKIK